MMKLKREHGLNVVIIFLIILALGLSGYLIYQYQQPSESKLLEKALDNSQASSVPAGIQNQGASCETIIDGKAFIRAAPQENASMEEEQRYANGISCLAKTGDTISFNDKCEATPTVLSAESSKINVKNEGKLKIEVRVITAKGEGVVHAIDPGQTQLFDLTGSQISFHMTSCYMGNQREEPYFDGRAAVILTRSQSDGGGE